MHQRCLRESLPPPRLRVLAQQLLERLDRVLESPKVQGLSATRCQDGRGCRRRCRAGERLLHGAAARSRPPAVRTTQLAREPGGRRSGETSHDARFTVPPATVPRRCKLRHRPGPAASGGPSRSRGVAAAPDAAPRHLTVQVGVGRPRPRPFCRPTAPAPSASAWRASAQRPKADDRAQGVSPIAALPHRRPHQGDVGTRRRVSKALRA